MPPKTRFETRRMISKVPGGCWRGVRHQDDTACIREGTTMSTHVIVELGALCEIPDSHRERADVHADCGSQRQHVSGGWAFARAHVEGRGSRSDARAQQTKVRKRMKDG
jgi:hypothetical protein